MKKKLLSVLVASSLALSLIACGGSEPTETASTEETSSIETDENLLTMELTIPAEYMEGTTQEELDASAAENKFISATLNDDGSVTYVMTKGVHKEYMAYLKNEMDKSLNELIESADYPNFTNIKTNSDYTSFTVTTKSTSLDMNESFSVLLFYMYGGLYNSFNGTTPENIHIEFVNADSGTIIESSDSKDLVTE